ncbi:hypothetical protein [uncultured Gammaproteobacteria bacterium]|nr:hypothetical protein [uncultured Gammaproteobacteria bacterium]CAC9473988.1 hypothetical protein [uncultured Gammaproteobacteria bacterium]
MKFLPRWLFFKWKCCTYGLNSPSDPNYFAYTVKLVFLLKNGLSLGTILINIKKNLNQLLTDFYYQYLILGD